MINVVEEVFELSIWEGLKVNNIDLTSCPKAKGEDRLDPRCRFISYFTADAYQTGLCVQLGDATANVGV